MLLNSKRHIDQRGGTTAKRYNTYGDRFSIGDLSKLLI